MPTFEEILENLEAYDGIIEVGISAGADPSLQDERKIRICENYANQDLKTKVITTLEGTRALVANHPIDKKLYVNAVIAIHKYGIASRDGRERTIVPAINATTFDVNPDIDAVNKALTVILATKINYLVMNHHVGQGALAGYALKAVNTLFIGTDTTVRIESIYDLLHMLGHWVDTHAAFQMMNIRGIQEDRRINGLIIPTLAMDFHLRVSAHPAGTAKLFVAYASLKKLLGSLVAKFTPRLSEMAIIISEHAKVMANPLAFHVGARFLTGEERLMYNETLVNSCLGRLGTFICILYPTSTLANSTVFKKGNVRVYETYDDFDDTFNGFCANFRTAVMEAAGRQTQNMILQAVEVADAEIQYLNHVANYPTLYDQLTQAHERGDDMNAVIEAHERNRRRT